MSHYLRNIFLVVTCVFALVTTAVAQEKFPPDYVSWTRVTARAQEAIENDRASEAAMETLRSELVSWRSEFSEETSKNRVSVDTLNAQIARLGPVNPNGEPEAVTVERDVLQAQLAEALAPVRRAELAYAEAEELVRSIDRLLRDRQARLLMEPGPVPLNPAHWAKAFEEVYKTFELIAQELQNGWKQERSQNELFKSLPTALFYLFLGLFLLIGGQRWAEARLSALVDEEDRIEQMSASRWIMAFCLSMGQVLVPMAGMFMIAKGIYAADLAGFRGDVVLSLLPFITFEILIAKWLGKRVFSRYQNPLVKISLTQAQKVKGRRAASNLGVALAANSLFGDLARYDAWSQETQSVVFFLLSLWTATFMVRLGLLIIAHAKSSTQGEDQERRTTIGEMIMILGRFMVAAAVVGVGLGVFGLTRAGIYLIYSAGNTVLLVAFLLILQRLVQKVFAALEGRDDDESSLGAVLTGVALAILSLPLLALTWGQRSSELLEVWARIAAGFQIGDLTLSPRMVFVLLAVYLAGHGITRLVQGFMRDNVLPKTRLDLGGQTAVVAGAGYVGIFLSALLALSVAGINLSNIALFAGALSVGIGFGLQTIVSNFVSGIILLIERPVSEGDWIEVGGRMGYVRDISVRATRIETFDRTDVVIPNSDLISGTVTNYTHGNTVGRVIVPVGVAYGTDTRRVEAVLMEIAQAHPMVLANPGPSVVFQGFGADSLDFEIRAILRDVNWMLTVKSDLNHEIARRFKEEGIEIPFAQRDVWLRNPEVLPGAESFAGSSRHNFTKEDLAAANQTSETNLHGHNLDAGDFDGDGDGDGGDGR